MQNAPIKIFGNYIQSSANRPNKQHILNQIDYSLFKDVI
jgi:hypothetical protein